MKTYITLVLFFIGIVSSYTQTTAIPDPNFEQVLIDLAIDSDATINGQVLTVDIANVTVLDIPDNHQVDNLIGIEDFSALKILDISHAGFAGFHSGTYPYILDLSQVHSLEELYMNGDWDYITVEVNYLDLSNNPNLKKIEIRGNWMIERINLQGSDLNITNLFIDLSGSYACIQVTNESDAENGQGVYANWTVCCNSTADYFSENCNLGTSSFTKNNLQLYPNPTTEAFVIDSQQNIETITIYDLKGKRIKYYPQPQENYSVTDLAKGLYLIEIRSAGNSKQTLKLLKN